MSLHHKSINQILEELDCEIREKPVSKKQDIPEDLCGVKDESIKGDQPESNLEDESIEGGDQPESNIEDEVTQAQQQAENSEKKTQQCIQALSQLTQQANNDADNMQKSASVETKIQELIDNYQIIFYYFEQLYIRFNKLLKKESENQQLSTNLIIQNLSNVEEVNLNSSFLQEFNSIETFEQLNENISSIIQNNNNLSNYISNFTNKIEVETDKSSSLYGLSFIIKMSPYLKQIEQNRTRPEPVSTPDNISQPEDPQGTNLDVDKRTETNEREVSIDITSSSFENGDIQDFFDLLNNFEFKKDLRDVENIENTGVLYTELYNLLEEPIDNLFTNEEKGLSLNKNDIDEEVADSEASKITINDKQYYVADIEQYNRFFNNTETKINERIQQIREQQINPQLNQIKSTLNIIIDSQIRNFLIYGFSVSENEQSETRLQNILDILKTNYQSHQHKYQLLQDKLNQANSTKQQSRQKLNNLPNQAKKIECFREPDQQPPNDNGSNPKGAFPSVTLENGEPQLNNMPDSNKPQPTQLCYWQKVAELTNKINLLPYPDVNRGGLRYWPVGLIVPTPNSVVKIPLPVKWNPITVISSSMGIMVLFINQCGILPCPFFMIIDSDNKSQFIISMRGPSESFGGQDYLEEIPQTLRDSVGIGDGVFKQSIKLPSPNIDSDSLNAINGGDSISSLFEDINRNTFQSIEKVGLPELPEINKYKSDMGESINDLPDDRKLELIQSDIKSFINNINLPQIKLPQDESKLEPKLSNPEKILSQFKDFLSFNFQVDSDLNLKTQVLSELDGIDLNSDINTSNLSNDLDLNTDLDSIKPKWTQMTNILIDRIKSQDKLLVTNQDISNILSNVQISATDCGLEDIDIDNQLNPQIELKINSLKQAINNIINNITSGLIISFIGTSKIEIGNIKDLFKELIRDQLPNISLPSDLLNFNFQQIFNNKISAAIKNPQIKLPFSAVGAPSTIIRQIPIDLNIIKSQLSDAVSNSIVNNINQDILDNLWSNTQTDFKSVFKNEINNNLKSIVENNQLLDSSISLLNSIPVPTGVNLDIPKALKINADPSQQERAKFGAEYATGLTLNISDVISFKDTNQSQEALEQLQNIDLLSYTVTTAAAATSPQAVLPIISVHPALNYENLPPWERLSLDNFLFVLYLDKLCNFGKIKGGFFEKP